MEQAFALARGYVLALPTRSIGRPMSPAAMAATLDEPLPDGPNDPGAGVREWFHRAEAGIAASPDLELMNPKRMAVTPLNVVCFRYVPAGLPDTATDDLNRETVTTIQRDSRVFVTGTTWNGRAALGDAFDNWATARADVELLGTVVREVGVRLRPR